MKFKDNNLLIKRAVFLNKENVALMALPDFIGYIFRLTKKSWNRVDAGDPSLETSPMVLQASMCIFELEKAGLFHFLDMDYWLQP